MTENRTYGFRIEIGDSYGDPVVRAVAMVRIDDGPSPINPKTGTESTIWDAPKRLEGVAIDGLGFHGHYYKPTHEPRAELIGFEPSYRDVYDVDRPTARGMVRALDRVYKRIERDDAREPGDVMMAAAQALGFVWVVERAKVGRAPVFAGNDYRDSDWRFMSLGEGRTRLRAMIDEARPVADTVAA